MSESSRYVKFIWHIQICITLKTGHVPVRFTNTLTTPTQMEFSKTAIFKPTQLEFYVKNNANENILSLVPMSNKAFGEGMQRIVSEMFGMSKPSETSHDAVYKGVPIEIKSARYWSGKLDCKWQHIMTDHKYKWVMLVLVDFQDLKFWLVSKDTIMKNPDVFTQQGGAEGQGRWCTMKKVLPLAHPVMSLADLDRLISS